MGAVFAVIGGSILYMTLFGIKENPEFSHQQTLNIIEAIKFTFFNRSFFTYVVPSFLLQFTYTMLTATLPFYAKYVLKASETQTTLLLASIFVVAFFLIPVWQK